MGSIIVWAWIGFILFGTMKFIDDEMDTIYEKIEDVKYDLFIFFRRGKR